jgi:two-component sensor histidine kinase
MEMRETVGEEMALVAEFNHRIFNTFQVIACAIAQSRKALRDRADMTCLVDLQERLAALGRMHRLLSEPAPDGRLEDHCRLLCILLLQAFGREDVTPWVVMDDLDLSPIQTCGLPLLVVELVTNVLKHSLADQADGVVWVDLHVRGGHIELTVTDNRKAPLPVFGPSRIVSSLARMLHGEAFVCDSNGWIAGARIPHEAPVAANAAWIDDPNSRGARRASAALNARPDRRNEGGHPRARAAEQRAGNGDDRLGPVRLAPTPGTTPA